MRSLSQAIRNASRYPAETQSRPFECFYSNGFYTVFPSPKESEINENDNDFRRLSKTIVDETYSVACYTMFSRKPAQSHTT